MLIRPAVKNMPTPIKQKNTSCVLDQAAPLNSNNVATPMIKYAMKHPPMKYCFSTVSTSDSECSPTQQQVTSLMVLWKNFLG